MATYVNTVDADSLAPYVATHQQANGDNVNDNQVVTGNGKAATRFYAS